MSATAEKMFESEEKSIRKREREIVSVFETLRFQCNDIKTPRQPKFLLVLIKKKM